MTKLEVSCDGLARQTARHTGRTRRGGSYGGDTAQLMLGSTLLKSGLIVRGGIYRSSFANKRRNRRSKVVVWTAHAERGQERAQSCHRARQRKSKADKDQDTLVSEQERAETLAAPSPLERRHVVIVKDFMWAIVRVGQSSPRPEFRFWVFNPVDRTIASGLAGRQLVISIRPALWNGSPYGIPQLALT